MKIFVKAFCILITLAQCFPFTVSAEEIAPEPLPYYSFTTYTHNQPFITPDYLAQQAQLVVRAEVLGNEINYVKRTDSGDVYLGYTLTEIKIIKILSDQTGYGLIEGDTLRITEDYYQSTHNDIPSIFARDNYAPSIAGTEYYFYLEPGIDLDGYTNLYRPTEGIFGRYPLLDDLDATTYPLLPNKVFSLGDKNAAHYRYVYLQVMAQHKWPAAEAEQWDDLMQIYATYTRENVSPVHYYFTYINSLTDLLAVNPVIVRGTVSNQKPLAYSSPINGAYGLPGSGYTLSELKVTQVIQGNIQPGDTLNITESYYTTGGREAARQTFGNYAPSNNHREYIFFLLPYDESDEEFSGYYAIVGGEYGRYPILTGYTLEGYDVLTNSELNLGIQDARHYKALCKEIVATYAKEFK